MNAPVNSRPAPDGKPFEETGTLKRDGGHFELLRDDNAQRVRLLLPRTPVDLVEKAVRVIGTEIEPGLVEASGVAPV